MKRLAMFADFCVWSFAHFLHDTELRLFWKRGRRFGRLSDCTFTVTMWITRHLYRIQFYRGKYPW